jgi:Protein of unknown function (DUF732)
MKRNVIAVAVGIAAGCMFAAVPAHADTKDDLFIHRLQYENIPVSSSDEAINLAVTICAGMDLGSGTYIDGVNYVKSKNPDMTQNQAAGFTLAAVHFYCPSHMPQ